MRLELWLVLVASLSSQASRAQNRAEGREVYGPCAGCHGESGEGGKGGEYPRLAGQPAAFLVDSLAKFQQRKRYNLPMLPYTERRELSEQDMKDVAAYLESIKLPSKPPEFAPSTGALDRLLALKTVLVVPRVQGDLEKGKTSFLAHCADCHGKDGRGRASREAPMLTGQYPSYLLNQYKAFRAGERGADEGDPMHGVLAEVAPKEFTDMLAWLTSIQDVDTPSK